MREVARIAETQDGLVTTGQAVRAGVPRLSLARLAEAGDVQRLAHGVYRVRGADADQYTELRAAWLAADPTRTAAERAADLGHPIVVSHRSAAAVHRIGNMYADRHEMTAPVRKQTRRSDVVVHRADVPRPDIVIARGMMVTTIERTLADLARTEPELGDVADALADAYRRSAVDLAALAPMLDAAARRHGAHDGAHLLQQMLELKGLDARTALEELAQSPELSRLLGGAWAAAIQSALEATMRDMIPRIAMRNVLMDVNLPVMSPALLEMARAASDAAMSSLTRETMGSLALTMGALPAVSRLTVPMNDVARLAQQALAAVPSGIVREAKKDE